MPRLWKDTVEEHRRDVRLAVLDAAWELAAERGVLGVTMAQVAEAAGIGRATLYKYFGGVEEILVAAHTHHVHRHLADLGAVRATTEDPAMALRRMFTAYARISFHRGRSAAPDLRGLVHSSKQHEHNEQRLIELFASVLREAQEAGKVRGDVTPEELALYCVSALAAASVLSTQAAVERVVGVIETGLHAV